MTLAVILSGLVFVAVFMAVRELGDLWVNRAR